MLKIAIKSLIFILLFSVFVISTVIILEKQFGFDIPTIIQIAPFILLSFYILFGKSELFFGDKPNPKWLKLSYRVLGVNMLLSIVFYIGVTLDIVEKSHSIAVLILTTVYGTVDIVVNVIRRKRI